MLQRIAISWSVMRSSALQDSRNAPAPPLRIPASAEGTRERPSLAVHAVPIGHPVTPVTTLESGREHEGCAPGRVSRRRGPVAGAPCGLGAWEACPDHNMADSRVARGCLLFQPAPTRSIFATIVAANGHHPVAILARQSVR
jgi:hypothetical protein